MSLTCVSHSARRTPANASADQCVNVPATLLLFTGLGNSGNFSENIELIQQQPWGEEPLSDALPS